MKKRQFLIGLTAALAAIVLLFGGCDKSKGGSGKQVRIKIEVYDRGTDGGKTNPTNNK